MRKLPHWVLTDKHHAFYDSESATAIEQTAKLYASMQDLIDEYNQFVDEINKHIEEWEAGLYNDFEEFKAEIRAITDRYIELLNIFSGLQQQIDQLVIEGDSSVEAAQARVSTDNDNVSVSYTTLKERLDTEHNETSTQLENLEVSYNTVATKISEMAYYVKPTGTADDKEMLQTAFNSYSHVVLKAGDYYVDGSSNPLIVPSDRLIKFEEGAIIHQVSTESGVYSILNTSGAENVTISNPQLVGVRDSQNGEESEFGHALFIDSKNIKIESPNVKNCLGDGIYIYHVENGVITNAIVDNCRRNGISVISCKNLLIDRAYITNINGTLPESGIDVEPNEADDMIEGLVIRNACTENCNYYGILIQLENIMHSNHNINIEITNHVDNGSRQGFIVSGMRPTAKQTGAIRLINPLYTNNGEIGIAILDYYRDMTPTLEVINPTIINPRLNIVQPTIPRYGGCGIVLNRETTYAGTQVMGNIKIENPVIIDNRDTPIMLRGIHVNDQKSVGYDDVKIINPIKITGVTDTNKIDGGTGNRVKVINQFETIKMTVTDPYYSLYNTAISLIDNKGASQITQININALYNIDQSITFRNMTTSGMLIVAPTDSMIYPIAQTAGGFVKSTEIGAQVTIRKLDDKNFIIENMTGTWTAS